MHPRLVRCRSDALEDQRQLSGVRRQISPSKRRRGVVAVLGIFERYLAALRECVAPQPHHWHPCVEALAAITRAGVCAFRSAQNRNCGERLPLKRREARVADKPAQTRVVAALLDRHGRTYCEELGIAIERNTPSVLF